MLAVQPSLAPKDVRLLYLRCCVDNCLHAGRCSALVKVAPDLSDIFIGHATWWTYTSMLKIRKHYTIELQGEQYNARTTSMSSYPGELVLHQPCHQRLTQLPQEVEVSCCYFADCQAIELRHLHFV
eukprot:GHRQ01013489.1.p2 GENE.GHRQ01013489.1~~GHRQ01013489.1.p2  ORF type:complete len:126 (-),score=37.54 GHRQ01013489.1:175-552(-)